MKDEDQSEEQSSDELAELRQKVADLEALETARKQEEQQDEEARQKTRKRNTLILTSIPILLSLCVFSINSEYLGTMIFSCKSRGIPNAECSQPYGWIMTGVFFLLLSVSYFVTQKTSILSKGIWWVNILLVILFLILPAVFILLLGPSSLIVIESYY